MIKTSSILRKIIWIPVLIMVMFIFVLSSQDGKTSYYTSMQVAMNVTNKDTVSEFLNGLFRIAAHSLEYFILSMLIGIAIKVNGIGGKLRCIYMVMLSGMVAIVDEFYQIFIPDRYGDLKDLAVDIIGASLAAVLVYLFTYKRWKRRLDYSGESREILGIHIDNIIEDAAINSIMNMAQNGKQEYIVTPNVDHIMIFRNNSDFREAYENASLVLTDGTPIMWIAEAYGCPITEKLSGSDMLPLICEHAAKSGKTLFILGAKAGVADKAASALKKKYKNLKIVGTYSPSSGFEDDEVELEKIYAKVNKCRPDILVLALGSPKQEIFILKHRDKMKFNVALPFGAAVDFQAGEVRRAPKWMRKVGLEWFYRFLQEPGRLFERYFINDMKIFWIAWKERPKG